MSDITIPTGLQLRMMQLVSNLAIDTGNDPDSTFMLRLEAQSIVRAVEEGIKDGSVCINMGAKPRPWFYCKLDSTKTHAEPCRCVPGKDV